MLCFGLNHQCSRVASYRASGLGLWPNAVLSPKSQVETRSDKYRQIESGLVQMMPRFLQHLPTARRAFDPEGRDNGETAGFRGQMSGTLATGCHYSDCSRYFYGFPILKSFIAERAW